MILPEIDPVALQIGPLAIRWYSLTWLAAFIGIYSLAKYRLKVFSTDKSDIAAKMESMVKSAVKSQNLIELMRLKEDDSRVLIYVKSGKNKDFVNEVLMFVKGIDKRTDGMSEAVVVSLTGSIDINKMSKLADTFTKSNKIKVKTNKK